MECEFCYNNTDTLYCYGIPSLKVVDAVWFGSVCCEGCQKAWLERHTLRCCDCGAAFIAVNIGVARHCGSCSEIYKKKTQNVSSENWRTRNKGLLSELEQSQWVETLTHFGNACAYCGGSYQVIEHFTPVKIGGGTGANNCVPACQRCNRLKRTVDGRTEKDELAKSLQIPVERLVQIESYLDRTAVLI